MKSGGEGGIRTPGTLSGTSVFKTDCFNRSHTSPRAVISSLPAMPPSQVSSVRLERVAVDSDLAQLGVLGRGWTFGVDNITQAPIQ